MKPTFLDKAISAIAPAWGVKRMAARQVLHEFSYNGARASNKRAQAPAQIAPNSFIVQRDRLQLLREAMDLENNFAPAKTLNRKYAMYVSPQNYNAMTGDHGLDTEVEQYLNEVWFPNCDATGRYGFWRMLEFGIMGMNRGGDYGWAYVREGAEEGMSDDDLVKLPLKIQGIEPDRIGGLYQNVVSEEYVSGIGIGQGGRVKFYRVFRRGMAAGQYFDPVDVPADQFVHYLDPMQLDMYRGVSKLDTATEALRDLYEMIDYAKGKSKLASALTVFTNSSGVIGGPGAMDPYATQQLNNDQPGLQTDIYYGQMNHLPNGSEIKFPDSATPGTETQYLYGLLLKLVCMSYNLPYSFGLDASALGGVSSRLESEQAKAEFERGQQVLLPHAHKLKDAALIDAIAKGIFPARVADKICRGRFGFRAHPQPDIGREATANVNLYQTGLLNPMKYWTENAQDPETTAAEMVRWHMIKSKAVEGTDFTVEEVFGVGAAKPLSITQSETQSTTIDETQGAPKTETKTTT
jgi:capsid protein